LTTLATVNEKVKQKNWLSLGFGKGSRGEYAYF